MINVLNIPAVLRETIEASLSCRIITTELISGKGVVNSVYEITSNIGKLILRFNDSSEYDRFRKEAWCYNAAAKVGVRCPRNLQVGIRDNYAFMILQHVEGKNGKEIVSTAELWHGLGEALRLIHGIEVKGFGEKIEDITNGSRYDWQKYVQQNRVALQEEDFIEKLNISDDALINFKQRLDELGLKDFVFGLNHGDYSLANVIVNDQDSYIIDWGSAEAHIVPHHDFAVILDESLNRYSQEFESFLRGYGMNVEEFNVISKDIETLQALEALDKLRWAFDKSPGRIDHYSQQFSKFVGRFQLR